MICLSDFVLVLVRNSSNSLMEQKLGSIFPNLIWEEHNYSNLSIYIGSTNKNCIMIESSRILLINGIFPVEKINKIVSELNYKSDMESIDHQGVLVILDMNSGELYAVRDLFGSRAIFYYITDHLVIVSNNINFIYLIIRASESYFNEEIELDLLGVYEFLIFDEIVSRHTLLKGIHRLLPGETLHISLTRTSYQIKPYVKLSVKNALTPEENAQLVAEVFRLIMNNIESFCNEVKDHRIAIPISGGLDSTLILSLSLRSCDKKKIQPIHINFGSISEKILTKYVCIKNDIECYTTFINNLSNKYFDLISEHLRLLDVPRPGDAALPYFLLAKTIKGNNIDIALCGDPGDTLFGGMDLYKSFLAQILTRKPILLIKIIKTLNKHDHVRITEILINTFLDMIKQAFYSARLKTKIKSIASNELKRNKRLLNLLTLYLYSLHRDISNYIINNYIESANLSMFKKQLLTRLILKSTHVIYTDVIVHEKLRIALFSPYASKRILEKVLSIDDAYFFAYGSRSIVKLYLKLLGYPSFIYDQPKSGFSTTHLIPVSDLMEDAITRSRLNKFINMNVMKKLKRNYIVKINNILTWIKTHQTI